jgi:hypothetical protein
MHVQDMYCANIGSFFLQIMKFAMMLKDETYFRWYMYF